MTQPSKRVQLDLSEKAFARLQHLKQVTEASSNADVIKNALRLYEAVVNETKSGASFQLKGSDGSVREYLIF